MPSPRLLLAISLAFPLIAAAQEDSVFKTPLTEGVAALRDAGWSIPKEGITETDGAIQITAADGKRQYMTFDLPVEKGVSYGGSIMVKSVDVRFRNNNDRGATFFFGMLTEDKKWVNGGEFPRGPFGEKDWQRVTIGMTRTMPDKVKYIQIWICIEGQGTALFKDLEVHKVSFDSKLTVKAGNNPPTFEFVKPLQTTGAKIQPKLRILLSQNPDFPEAETFAEMTTTVGRFTLPYALKPGKWFVKSCWCGLRIYPESATISFTINDLPTYAPLKAIPKFQSGVFSERPDIAFSFYPQPPQTCSATIDGKPLDIKSQEGKNVVFTPKEPLAQGIYDIAVTANGKTDTFVFINKNPAHQFTFRDDHMLCIDGKPFFPIGTYRDPSDDTTVFDGIHEANFNVTHSYKFENNKVTDADMTRYLDDCQKNGVYAFMGIPRRHLQSEDHHALQKHCAAMYDHPGLLSFYLADEPELWINRFSMKAGADAVGAACPHVPRILLLCTPELNNDDIRYMGDGLSEILWHDPYPVPRAPISSVKTTMETMRTICHDKQSLWCVVQAFDWDQSAVKKKKPEDVEPKAGKIRCMTHLALSANVQGIIYYWLPKDRYDMRKHSPIQWAETVACAQELNSLYKFLIGRNAPQNIKLPNGVEYWCRRAEDDSYAVGLINTTDKEVSLDVDVVGFKKQLTLPPWGVEVLK
ncbi:MAG: hypothetical protein IJU61_15100 [Victivallales bacterium]|nr:hypothetical protein [Victivallales bacterium]